MKLKKALFCCLLAFYIAASAFGCTKAQSVPFSYVEVCADIFSALESRNGWGEFSLVFDSYESWKSYASHYFDCAAFTGGQSEEEMQEAQKALDEYAPQYQNSSVIALQLFSGGNYRFVIDKIEKIKEEIIIYGHLAYEEAGRPYNGLCFFAIEVPEGYLGGYSSEKSKGSFYGNAFYKTVIRIKTSLPNARKASIAPANPNQSLMASERKRNALMIHWLYQRPGVLLVYNPGRAQLYTCQRQAHCGRRR